MVPVICGGIVELLWVPNAVVIAISSLDILPRLKTGKMRILEMLIYEGTSHTTRFAAGSSTSEQIHSQKSTRYYSALCSSSLKMQQPASNYPLEKDKDIPVEEWHLNVETEQPQCGPENSKSDSVPWKLLATEPLSCMEKTESPCPEVQPQGCRAYPQAPLRSLSKKHCENQGNLLHFDRQAPGRISTSPTLRRLRGSGYGTARLLPQQETLEMPPRGSWKELAGSPCYISKSLPGSPKESSHSLSPLRLHSRLLTDPERTLNTADPFEPQKGPTDEDALPVLQPTEERSLPQALLPRRGGHSPPSPAPRPPSPQDKTWNEIMETYQKRPTDQLDLRKQQEAVWELFTSECSYFLDHLLVLKMIFMNTLKYLQTHEYLLDVDLWRLFANLEELSQTSFSFVNGLFGIIKGYVDASETSPSMDFISVLTKLPVNVKRKRKSVRGQRLLASVDCPSALLFLQYFRGNLCQSHQTYCLNYSAAVFYLESLRQRDDFGIYLKWCEQNEQCRRLHLPELLVAPLHRLTRYPLLLKNIWKRSTDSTEKILIYSIKEKVEKSIRDLEGKVKWLDNFQKCRHLQEIIVWPPLWDRDKRFFIPECLRHVFKEHMAENILSPTNRHLLYEGKLTLAESTRFLDVYLFLFDDFLLVTKTKRNKKKLAGSDIALMCPSLTPELQTVIKEGGSCTVLDQPIPLDRLVVKSIDPLHVSATELKSSCLSDSGFSTLEVSIFVFPLIKLRQ
ncbi:hypothetical protein HPG69_001206 [Diceros bicornis minor]|uniref:DH domain-containing protein n=1 Tax=Diceros bicornis minor TaxID=77932 RepID=A0A7J7FF74_DICBM|nr:hypothetical protein HPG69_001206 [Diceros bicornis minor]